MADSSISVKLEGFDPITKALEASARIAEAHNKLLELMTPPQREKALDMWIEDRKAFSDFGAPFRALFDKIADAVKGDK